MSKHLTNLKYRLRLSPLAGKIIDVMLWLALVGVLSFYGYVYY